MEWVWGFLGGGNAPKRPVPKAAANDPLLRLAKFKRVYHTILQLCNRPRNLTSEGPLLDQLQSCLGKVVTLIREEARAPIPHPCLQFVAANQVYAVCARAATVSQHEPIIQSTVAVYAALVDSEEEDFLSSAAFAKSLMRLVRKVVESGTVLVTIDTETAILELLFTISAKIRLQPEILSSWFQSSVKPELEDVFLTEKKSFVGITQKDDFPLCYLLIDRVHHDGRIGDFARTGLLYIFEATGRSDDLEQWVVSSDLPTLMASGLGALYSQLNRELSILHPDATLPAVLAMSDYSTTHPRATAESAFSERHRSHMATFLSYLAFWQDVLDHCSSADVKQTLLDHFQILFLRQLLYPSLLQSSDTDAGSSIAVLTYMTAMLESLEYPDLMNMMLEYLLAIEGSSPAVQEAPLSPTTPRSPNATRRRQSLMLLTTPNDPNDAVEPSLFNLVDLIMNNVTSKNDQSVFAALKLASTLLNRQKNFAFGTLLNVQSCRRDAVGRTTGALDVELEKLNAIATSFHHGAEVDCAYAGLTEDTRLVIEAQIPFLDTKPEQHGSKQIGCYRLPQEDHLLRAMRDLLATFFTNSVDVNLGLTQAIICIALCVEVRLDGWLAVHPSNYPKDPTTPGSQRDWHAHLDEDENAALSAVKKAANPPTWSDTTAPLIHTTLQALASELDALRATIPNLDHLISGRKHMLQATGHDTASHPPSSVASPTQATFLEVPNKATNHSRSSSHSSLAIATGKATGYGSPASLVASSSPTRKAGDGEERSSSTPVAVPTAKSSVFLPPPPETPSTTDVLMQTIKFPVNKAAAGEGVDVAGEGEEVRKASLNHVLTNVVVLQEFVLEVIAVLQVRAAVLGEREVKVV
ncbi:uncharacterized protein LTR77_001887 [Saxophila tyrrhenica]|uniref:Retinoic acid induced 16-like protein-domain-containing protein n=1 Tax=Saxophila tyrrhenica TaxID=1690608 RepID=A0AAV9PPY0_9PEZI|nr:hypothetical protein LTR77_001887 [Saxophila tyrrhenica]